MFNGGELVDCDGLMWFVEVMVLFGFDVGVVLFFYGFVELMCVVIVLVFGIGLFVDCVIDGSGVYKYVVLGNFIFGMEVWILCGDQVVGNVSCEIGEIEICGVLMMVGYLGQQLIDFDDWFVIGDFGYFGVGGLVVCGCVKEVIFIVGCNIFLMEVELVVV